MQFMHIYTGSSQHHLRKLHGLGGLARFPALGETDSQQKKKPGERHRKNGQAEQHLGERKPVRCPGAVLGEARCHVQERIVFS